MEAHIPETEAALAAQEQVVADPQVGGERIVALRTRCHDTLLGNKRAVADGGAQDHAAEAHGDGGRPFLRHGEDSEMGQLQVDAVGSGDHRRPVLGGGGADDGQVLDGDAESAAN